MNAIHPLLGHNNLDFIKIRIAAGHARAVKGGTEWIEGSLEVAAALREGRDAIPADLAFKDWLKQNQLDFYSHHERAALINLGKNIELARTVLTETDSRSYKNIWLQNKTRFVHLDNPRTRKPRSAKSGRSALFRAMKLGEDTIAKVKGTSLDNADEMDELVILNRGAPQGELTEVVGRLIDAAAAGQHVSAIVEAAKMGGKRSFAGFDLTVNWKRRMVASWKLAKPKQRVEFIEHLISDLDILEQQLLITRLMQQKKEES